MPKTRTPATNSPHLASLIAELSSLRDGALALEARYTSLINDCMPPQQLSARNLLHYLSVRQKDIRPLQQQLLSSGLSSLGTMESHTLAHLNAVLNMLQNGVTEPPSGLAAPVDVTQGAALLAQRTQALLGFLPPGRSAHIMVTMPTEAAQQPELCRTLLGAGMGVMRINCAHDQPATWRAMVDNLRRAEQTLGLGCKIQADLAGPKMRTGSIESRGQLLKLKPRRDAFGRLIAPLRLTIVPESRYDGFPVEAGGLRLCVSDDFFEHCQSGDCIVLKDCRGKNRSLDIVEVHPDRCIAQTSRAIYISHDCCLCLQRQQLSVARCFPLHLPELSLPILLHPGHHLMLTRFDVPGRPGYFDALGQELAPACIHCTLDAAFSCAEAGQRVWFDDGKIGGVIVTNDGDDMLIRITHARHQGSALWPEKGINFPDTVLTTQALTQKDLSDLKQVSAFADIIALSFVRQPADLEMLHQELNQLGRPDTGIVLKIENREAFDNLPWLLLAGLGIGRPFGVMIARGDLAVEVGFERLSELQQEIIWLCEAAHVPVIWATQILESMAKTGVPSRAEVSDAGMSVLTECVMLNKGPYIVETVQLLSGILARMDQHYHKRRMLLRRLKVAEIEREVV